MAFLYACMSLSFYVEEWKEKLIVQVKECWVAIGVTWSKLFPWPIPFF